MRGENKRAKASNSPVFFHFFMHFQFTFDFTCKYLVEYSTLGIQCATSSHNQYHKWNVIFYNTIGDSDKIE